MKCPFYISLLLCCIIGLAACTGPVILEEEEKTEIKNGDEDKNEDSADEDKKDKGEKDGCNKDSAFMTKDDMLTALKAELAPMVADAVKECLGLKDGKPSVEGSELDSMEKTVVRDYTSFLE